MSAQAAIEKAKQIAERLRQQRQQAQPAATATTTTATATVAVAPRATTTATPTATATTTATVSNLAAMQAQIQAQIAALKARGIVGANTGGAKRAKLLRVDAQGNVVDESGKVLQTKRGPDLAINHKTTAAPPGTAAAAAAAIAASVTATVAATTTTTTTKAPPKPANPYYDDKTEWESRTFRPTKALQFHDPGYYQDMAKRERAREKLEKLQQEIASAAKNASISSATQLALVSARKEELEQTVVPDVEWWDSVILGAAGYDSVRPEDDFTSPEITHLIQHPVTFEPPEDKTSIPVYLTQQERKKMRTQRRKAAEQEKQEKIQLGLMEPPPPKVKISNLMRVLGAEAVQDPTKVEALVREQMRLRKLEHEQRNSERQLTKEERREKRIRKLKAEEKDQVHVALFTVGSLKDNFKNKNRIIRNAEQLYLTGGLVMTEDRNIVLVEGSAKNLRFYKRLLLVRLKWDSAVGGGEEPQAMNEDDEDDDMNGAAPAPSKANFCNLAWEGIEKQHLFKKFEVKFFATEALARDYLEKKKAAHYWDRALESFLQLEK